MPKPARAMNTLSFFIIICSPFFWAWPWGYENGNGSGLVPMLANSYPLQPTCAHVSIVGLLMSRASLIRVGIALLKLDFYVVEFELNSVQPGLALD